MNEKGGGETEEGGRQTGEYPNNFIITLETSPFNEIIIIILLVALSSIVTRRVGCFKSPYEILKVEG